MPEKSLYQQISNPIETYTDGYGQTREVYEPKYVGVLRKAYNAANRFLNGPSEEEYAQMGMRKPQYSLGPAEWIAGPAKVISGTVSKKADRYYVSVIIDVDMPIVSKNTNEGIGIDLGLKDFAICSNGEKYKNINKTQKIRKIEKKLKREQKKLSRKYENLKKKGVEVQKLHHKLDNIRTDYVNKTISNIINQKPKFITIEALNVKGMMKNRHLSKAVANQKFYEFRNKLTTKCNALGIELRIVDRFYPSSKLCHCCGSIKKDLKLKDRIYKCECGYIEDRDYNASLNLRDCLTYKIAQ